MQMCEVMFGDVPLSEWIHSSAEGEPWATFRAAERVLGNDPDSARGHLEAILAMQNLETRHQLEAWHALRGLGVNPPEAVAKQVLGVILEVALPEGLDVLGAYADHTARYWNHSGAGVVLEHPDSRLDGVIDDLLENGATVCQQIGPWDGPRPRDLPLNQARISLLTASGLHFGQGPFEALSVDLRGGPVISAATRLMLAITKLGARA